MTIKKPWKVVGGTLVAAVALGTTAVVAQTGNNMPDTIDLDDSIASVSDDADDTSADADTSYDES